MRGEYAAPGKPRADRLELPPRARRILCGCRHRPARPGTTSACAENTCGRNHQGLAGRNYLRVRGEYEAATAFGREAVELPPRARRIPHDVDDGVLKHGTTSACAENTGWASAGDAYRWNYLRVRGEYSTRIHVSESSLELPPRARRIPDIAGNRESSFVNYLRVRGEYSPGKTSTPGFVELPPRARRIPFDGMECANLRGTTSACAENTVSASVSSGFTWNYLRVRGEYLCTAG